MFLIDRIKSLIKIKINCLPYRTVTGNKYQHNYFLVWPNNLSDALVVFPSYSSWLLEKTNMQVAQPDITEYFEDIYSLITKNIIDICTTLHTNHKKCV